MLSAYPVFIKKSGKDYLVYVPDFEIYTEGTSFADAIVMARDAIGLKGVDYTDDGRPLPAESSVEEALRKARADADDDFDFSDGRLTFVDVDIDCYRERMRNRAVRKNCTIPYWLNEKAEAQGINFSQVLQEGLMAKLA